MGWGPALTADDRRKHLHARQLATRVHRWVNHAQGLRCERCDTNERPLHKHHPDYDKPRVVVWLCAPCHAEVHRRFRGVRGLDGLRVLINQVRNG